MQQMILLEKTDIDAIKKGGTLTINAGGTAVTIGYLGRKTTHESTAATDEEVLRPTGTKQKQKKKTCHICSKLVAPQGRAPHLAMHRRNGELK